MFVFKSISCQIWGYVFRLGKYVEKKSSIAYYIPKETRKNMYVWKFQWREISLCLLEEDGFLKRASYSADKIPLKAEYRQTPLLKKACCQLEEYFEGKRKSFDIPLCPEGTEFQKRVWQALLKIPYGQTATYKDIAAATGNIKAVRAVGMANNRNPVAIFIPCHRIIGSNGKLVGYAGGLDIKKKLLQIEKLS